MFFKLKNQKNLNYLNLKKKLKLQWFFIQSNSNRNVYRKIGKLKAKLIKKA